MFSHKTLLIMSFLVSIIVLSGCIENIGDENLGDTPANISSISDTISTITDNTSTVSDNYSLDSMVIIEKLPTGYEIMGTLPITDYDEYSEYIIDAREGAYRDNEGIDVFLDIIELHSEQNAFDFISKYKTQYEPLATGDRFITISFNGHSAERIIEYKYSAGNQIPKYKIIWNKGNIVFVVRSNSHLESSSLELAKATGY